MWREFVHGISFLVLHIIRIINVGFDILSGVTVICTVFWDVMLYSLVEIH
jgi:hypothetical protein